MRSSVIVSALLAIGAIAQTADAAPVTYDFTGTIPPLTGIGPGTAVSGRFTYNTAGPFFAFTTPSGGAIYRAAQSVSFTSAIATNASSNAAASSVQINDNPTQNRFLFSVIGGFAGGNGLSFDISLTDTTGTALSGLGIPASLDLASFNCATASYSSRDSGESFVASIDSLTLVQSAVPEPATWGLMLLGFGAAGAAKRRRPKVQSTVSFG